MSASPTGQGPASGGSQAQTSTTMQVRVRYQECDPQNMVHHSVYPIWLEMARTELLREQGAAYADLEKAGVFIVVARLSLRFHRPAMYDDVIRVTCNLVSAGGAKIEHRYEVHRGDVVLCTAQTTLVCVTREGRMIMVPEAMRYEP